MLGEEQKELLDKASFAPCMDLPCDTSLPEHRPMNDFIDHIDDYLKMFKLVTERAAAVRRPGAAALDLAYVAQGRFGGAWESALSDWDTAAGCLLVRGAGGFVSVFRARSLPIHADQVLAGNDVLHSKLHKLLAGSLR